MPSAKPYKPIVGGVARDIGDPRSFGVLAY